MENKYINLRNRVEKEDVEFLISEYEKAIKTGNVRNELSTGICRALWLMRAVIYDSAGEWFLEASGETDNKKHKWPCYANGNPIEESLLPRLEFLKQQLKKMN